MTDDKPKGDTAPSSPTSDTKPKPKRKRKASGGRRKALKAPLTELISTLGIGVCVVNAYDGQRILAGAEDLAAALDKVAKEQPAVQRALEAVVTGSTWGSVALAAAPIIIPICANHGLIPPATAELVGAPPPPTTGAPASPGEPANGQTDVVGPTLADLMATPSAPTRPPGAAVADEPSDDA